MMMIIIIIMIMTWIPTQKRWKVQSQRAIMLTHSQQSDSWTTRVVCFATSKPFCLTNQNKTVASTMTQC